MVIIMIMNLPDSLSDSVLDYVSFDLLFMDWRGIRCITDITGGTLFILRCW